MRLCRKMFKCFVLCFCSVFGRLGGVLRLARQSAAIYLKFMALFPPPTMSPTPSLYCFLPTFSRPPPIFSAMGAARPATLAPRRTMSAPAASGAMPAAAAAVSTAPAIFSTFGAYLATARATRFTPNPVFWAAFKPNLATLNAFCPDFFKNLAILYV